MERPVFEGAVKHKGLSTGDTQLFYFPENRQDSRQGPPASGPETPLTLAYNLDVPASCFTRPIEADFASVALSTAVVDVEPLVDMKLVKINDHESIGPFTRGKKGQLSLDLAMGFSSVNRVVPILPDWLLPENLQSLNQQEMAASHLMAAPEPYWHEIADLFFACKQNPWRSKRKHRQAHKLFTEYIWTRRDKINIIDRKMILDEADDVDLSHLTPSELLLLGGSTVLSQITQFEDMWEYTDTAGLLSTMNAIIGMDSIDPQEAAEIEQTTLITDSTIDTSTTPFFEGGGDMFPAYQESGAHDTQDSLTAASSGARRIPTDSFGTSLDNSTQQEYLDTQSSADYHSLH